MTNLVERYVYQVGQYVPQDEREEIQNELRSLIQDQLDDRYKGSPTEDDIVELLEEFGDPRKMAASYSSEQYLIGPDLYPTMMRVLYRGWLWIPAIVVVVRVLLAFLSAEPGTLIGLFLETAFTVVQAVFVFSGIVVLIFAILQHSGEDLEEAKESFNPLDLPPVDEPATVDRGEVAFGIAFNTFVTFVFIYFLRVGGLTLRFNLAEPVAVLPVPTSWLVVLIGTFLVTILISILALRRGRWSISMLLTKLVVDVVSIIAGYFVIIQPLFGLLYEQVPALATLPFADNVPLIISAILLLLTVIDNLSKLAKIAWGRKSGRPFISIEPEA